MVAKMNNKGEFMIKIGLILVMFALSGCASVQMASLDSDSQAKKFDVTPGKSSVYIFRDENFGGAIKIPISLNDKMIGQTAPNVFFNVISEPGQIKIKCFGETDGNLLLTTKPDQIYFVKQEMKMGMWVAGCAIYEVSETEGKLAVTGCNMAQLNQ
jgi:hypothetical protein